MDNADFADGRNSGAFKRGKLHSAQVHYSAFGVVNGLHGESVSFISLCGVEILIGRTRSPINAGDSAFLYIVLSGNNVPCAEIADQREYAVVFDQLLDIVLALRAVALIVIRGCFELVTQSALARTFGNSAKLLVDVSYVQIIESAVRLTDQRVSARASNRRADFDSAFVAYAGLFVGKLFGRNTVSVLGTAGCQRQNHSQAQNYRDY